jgi:ABC-type lipoprotein release transport system permease subunit
MSFHYFIFWIKTAFFFLFRSRRSTLALSLMVVVAVAALIFLSALAVGINDTMIRNSVGIFSGHISGYSIPESVDTDNLKLKGVDTVLKRISVPGLVSANGRIVTINMMGIDPGIEFDKVAIWKKKIKGRFIREGEDAVFLSSTVSDALNVQPGDELIFKSGYGDDPINFIVAGIYQTGIDYLDRGIAFCPIEVLQGKSDIWSAAIFLKEGVEPEKIINEYHNKLSGIVFKSWKEQMPDLLQLIDLNYVSMSIVMFLVFGVVSIGIACAFVIFILKNLREYGIMKSMGVTPGEIGYLITTEVLIMNITASIIGILVGLAAVIVASKSGIDLSEYTSHNRYFAVSGVIFPRLTFYSLFLPPVLCLFFSMMSAIWPLKLVAGKKAAEILRSH